MNTPRTTREAVFLYHDAITSECASICSLGASFVELEESKLDKRIIIAPPELLEDAKQMVIRLAGVSEAYCAQFERKSWRSITPPIIIRDVNAATLYTNKAFSVSRLSDFDREYQLAAISQFLQLALLQWSPFEVESAQIRYTQAQIDRYHQDESLYTLRPSGNSFRINAVTDSHTKSQTENLNQLLVLVGMHGTPVIQTRNDRKQRPAKERIPKIYFSGGSVICDSKDLTLQPVTFY